MGLATASTSIKMFGDMILNLLNDDGTDYEGNIRIPNVTAFGYQPQSDTDSIIGTELDNEGQTLDSLTTTDELLVNITRNRFTGAALALDSRGTESEITSGTENFTDEAVQLYGGTGDLARFDVASVVVRGLDLTVDDTTSFTANTVLTNQTTGATIGVVQSVPDGTSLYVFLTGIVPSAADVVTDGTNTATIAGSGVADKNDLAAVTTDYTVTAVNGRIAVVSGAALDISNLTKIKVNYTHTKLVGSRIAIGARTVTKGRLHLKGKNKVTSKKVAIYLPEVTLSPNGLISFITDNDRASSTLEGTAAVPSGWTSSGYFDLGA